LEPNQPPIFPDSMMQSFRESREALLKNQRLD